MKLHGSIDWVNDVIRSADGVLPQRVTRPRGIRDSPVNRVLSRDDSEGPAIVIGNREKLETEGATLALFRAFQTAMRRADRLVVVGYSGGDAHVNAEIRDWVNANPERSMTVLDPRWPVERHDEQFLAELNNRLGGSDDHPNLRPRLRIVRAKTEQGLGLALSAQPGLTPRTWFTASSVLRDEWVDFTLTTRDRDISSIEFQPNRIEDATSEYPGIEVFFDYDYKLTLPWLGPNESVTVSFKYQDAADAACGWAVMVRAVGHLSVIEEKFEAGAS